MMEICQICQTKAHVQERNDRFLGWYIQLAKYTNYRSYPSIQHLVACRRDLCMIIARRTIDIEYCKGNMDGPNGVHYWETFGLSYSCVERVKVLHQAVMEQKSRLENQRRTRAVHIKIQTEDFLA